MKIEIIEVPEPRHMAMMHGKRCARKTKSTGTWFFNNKKHQCSRLARFHVDGVPLCTQHAGEAALTHLLEQQANPKIVTINFGGVPMFSTDEINKLSNDLSSED